ncbi:MAG: hypothetical protein R3A10_15145 [Caldilineaceae bacterium]
MIWRTHWGLTDEPWTLPDTTVLKAKGDDYFVPVDWPICHRHCRDQAGGRHHGPRRRRGGRFGLGPLCTNEENYLFQKFMRAGMGTNNVDHLRTPLSRQHGHRPGHGLRQRRLDQLHQRGAGRGLRAHHRLQHGRVPPGHLVRGGARSSGAQRSSSSTRGVRPWSSTPRSGSSPPRDGHLHLPGHGPRHPAQGWADMDFVQTRTEGFDAFAAALEEYTPDVAALHSGVPAADIERAAHAATPWASAPPPWTTPPQSSIFNLCPLPAAPPPFSTPWASPSAPTAPTWC